MSHGEQEMISTGGHVDNIAAAAAAAAAAAPSSSPSSLVREFSSRTNYKICAECPSMVWAVVVQARDEERRTIDVEIAVQYYGGVHIQNWWKRRRCREIIDETTSLDFFSLKIRNIYNTWLVEMGQTVMPTKVRDAPHPGH